MPDAEGIVTTVASFQASSVAVTQAQTKLSLALAVNELHSSCIICHALQATPHSVSLSALDFFLRTSQVAHHAGTHNQSAQSTQLAQAGQVNVVFAHTIVSVVASLKVNTISFHTKATSVIYFQSVQSVQAGHL